MQRANFQDSLHGMLSWFLDFRSMILDREGEHRPEAMARHIACCYRELGISEAAGTPHQKLVQPLVEASYLSADHDYRRLVLDICEFVNKRMGNFITHFYLHGSLATLDYEKGWSDVDTFMVIKQDVVRDGSRLLVFRRLCLEAWNLFLKVTPLQHHGFIIATEGDLLAYPSHYLPLPVFDQALGVLHGQQPACLFLRSDDNGAERNLLERRRALQEAVTHGVFKYHPRNGVYLMSHYQNAEDAMVQLHSLLGYVVNVPAYFLDAVHQPCYKKESFVRARQYFSDKAWSIIERATAVRSTWFLKEGMSYTGNAIPNWVQEMLGPNYIEDSLYLVDEAVALINRMQPMTHLR